jgi:hypothetical protein
MKKILALLLMFVLAILQSGVAEASHGYTPSNFPHDNIIANSVFRNTSSMSASEIQSFLNARGGELASKTFNTDEGPASAARVIYDASRYWGINPQVTMATLQKEQSLITATNPHSSQYDSAMGYACPTSGSCDPDKKGFVKQVWNGVFQLRYNFERASGNNSWGSGSYVCTASSSTDKAYYDKSLLPGNTVGFRTSTSASPYRTVKIFNAATASLYCYTPHAYNLDPYYSGSKNFLTSFEDWFGSTVRAYDATVDTIEFFSDQSMETEISEQNISAGPGQKLYVRVTATNVGYRDWENSFTKIATLAPRNHRDNIFLDSSWSSLNRPARVDQASVSPTSTGTFEFAIKMPQDIGNFSSTFGLVAEGKAWMDIDKFEIDVDVEPTSDYDSIVTSYTTYSNSALTSTVDLNRRIVQTGETIYVKFLVRNIGRETLEQTFYKVATVDPRNHSDSVFKDTSWAVANRPTSPEETSIASGEEGSFIFALKMPDEEGVYDDSFGLVAEGYSWMDDPMVTIQADVRDHPEEIAYGATLNKGDRLISHNKQYRLIFQGDGNLVLYKSGGQALWSTRTNGSGASRLILQGDGNLVLYKSGGQALWSTRTNGSGASRLILQNDGNLVIYKFSGGHSWASGTNR